MFLVGHAMVAFLIAYLVSRRFRPEHGVISFALVMLIGTLPDVDVIFQALGIMPHKTYTHSVVISAIVAPAIFFVARVPFRQTAVAASAYALAYAQHMLDDVIVGTLNVLYPFGELAIGIGINYGSLLHLVLEVLLLALVTAIVMNKSFRKQHDSALANFRMVDKVSYVLLILSFTVSFAYLLYEMKSLPRLFIESQLEIAVFVLLHISALALVSFHLFVSRHYAKHAASEAISRQ